MVLRARLRKGPRLPQAGVARKWAEVAGILVSWPKLLYKLFVQRSMGSSIQITYSYFVFHHPSVSFCLPTPPYYTAHIHHNTGIPKHASRRFGNMIYLHPRMRGE